MREAGQIIIQSFKGCCWNCGKKYPKVHTVAMDPHDIEFMTKWYLSECDNEECNEIPSIEKRRIPNTYLASGRLF